MNINRFYLIVCVFLLSACQHSPTKTSLYEQLGGMPTIERIAGNFVNEIGHDQHIAVHFQETNLDRFYSKMVEHLCMVADGPCEYTGDSMLDIHEGMNITEAEFNQTVDLLINAMDKSGVSMRLRNKLLGKLAPLRGEIIYR